MLFTLFAFVCGSVAFAQEVSSTDLPQLKKQVVELLGQKYPDYSVLQSKDTSQSLQRYFESKHPNEYPGLVFGNFRHPSITDCAVLLVDSKKPELGIKLLVLVLDINASHPEVQIVQDYKNEKDPLLEVYLSYEQRRTIADVEKNSWVDMPSAGFSLNPFDRGGERVFYWNNEKLKSVWVTD